MRRVSLQSPRNSLKSTAEVRSSKGKARADTDWFDVSGNLRYEMKNTPKRFDDTTGILIVSGFTGLIHFLFFVLNQFQPALVDRLLNLVRQFGKVRVVIRHFP